MTSDVSAVSAPKRHGLAVLADTIVAPSAAFASLQIRPTWGWAFVLTAVLGMIGGYLQIPAGEHVFAYIIAHDPHFATKSSEQISAARMLGEVIQLGWIAWPIVEIVAILLASLFLLVGNAIGRGTATFAKIFALCANVSFIHFGLGYLLTGIVIAIRGGDSFNTRADLLGAIPSLGMLAPGAPVPLHSFLTFFSVTQLWSLALLALGLRAIGDVKPAAAWGAPIAIAFSGGLTAFILH